MPTPRALFGIAVCQNKIYCIGGYTATVTSYFDLGVNEVYDPATDSWETKAAMPTPRNPVTAKVVNDKIYVLPLFDRVCEVYDPFTDSWTTKTPPPYEISGTLAVVDDKIYSIGRDPGSWGYFVQVYDPANDSWTIRNPAPKPGLYAAADVTSGVNAPKRIYLFEETATSVYDPATDSWTFGAPMPTARACASATIINDTFYVIGGRSWQQIFLIEPSTVNEQYTPFLFGIVPAVGIYSPKNVTYTSTDVELNFWVNRSTSWIGYSLDGRANITVSGNTHNLSLTGLSEGTHRLTVYTRNVAGDVTSSSTVYFTVDMSPPSIAIMSPQNKTYGPANVQLAFTVNEKASWIGYSLDSQANVTITGNTTLPELSLGPHNLTVYAKDTAGYVGASETVYFTVAPQEPFPTALVVGAAAVTTAGGAAITLGVVTRRRKRSAPSKTPKIKTT